MTSLKKKKSVNTFCTYGKTPTIKTLKPIHSKTNESVTQPQKATQKPITMSNLRSIVNFRKCVIFLVFILYSMPLNGSSLNGGSLENGQTDSSQQIFRRIDGK